MRKISFNFADFLIPSKNKNNCSTHIIHLEEFYFQECTVDEKNISAPKIWDKIKWTIEILFSFYTKVVKLAL